MEYLSKLKDIEETKERICYMRDIRKGMLKFYDFLKDENENIHEYKKEMDELYKEKMTHVEELRLIHTDINLMEMVIKQSNEHRNYCIYEAKRLYEEYMDSKNVLKGLKTSLGLEDEELIEMEDGLFKDEKDQEDFESLLRKPSPIDCDNAAYHHHHVSNADDTILGSTAFLEPHDESGTPTKHRHHQHQAPLPEVDNTYQALADFANNRALSLFGLKRTPGPPPPTKGPVLDEESADYSTGGGEEPPPGKKISAPKSAAPNDSYSTRDFGFYNFHQVSPSTFGSAPGNAVASNMTNNNYTFEMPVPPFSCSSSMIHRPSSAIFRNQQPPPMKTCLSCHQQIHRNAPICPLCKAKSRSRNPKKPKKKL